MDCYEKDIKVQLSFRQKINYYWWTVYFWTAPFIIFIFGLYYLLFKKTTGTGEIKYVFYLGILCFIIGLVGYFILKNNLKFKFIETNLSQEDNYELILKVKKNLNWKKIEINKKRIVVSSKGYDILPGQLITIIPKEDRIYYNCVHTTHKFTDPSIKSEMYRLLREQIDTELKNIK